MDPMNGIEATKAIREFSQDIKIIGISVHTDQAYINALMRRGAMDILPRTLLAKR